MKQLLLFDMETDPSKKFEKMQTEWERTRKSLYMKEAALTKEVKELKYKLEWLELHLCKGKIVL